MKIGIHEVYAIRMGSGCIESAISAASLLARYPCDLAISLGPVGALTDKFPRGKWHRVARIIPYQCGTDGHTGFRRDADLAIEPLAPELEHICSAVLGQSLPLTIASGEVFVASTLRRHELAVSTEASAVDMNLLGLTLALKAARVPHLALRIVSDRADDQAGQEFRAFTERYQGEGGRLAAEIIRKLPLSPASPESYPALEKLMKPEKP